MRCNFPIVYRLKPAYSICAYCTDRQPVNPFTPVKSPLNEMQFSDRIGLARSDEHYRSTERIFKLNQIVCIGQPSLKSLKQHVSKAHWTWVSCATALASMKRSPLGTCGREGFAPPPLWKPHCTLMRRYSFVFVIPWLPSCASLTNLPH